MNKSGSEWPNITLGGPTVPVETDGNSMNELRQLVADYEAANVGAIDGARQLLATQSEPDKGGVSPSMDGAESMAAEAPAEQTEGNMPVLPLGQEVVIQKSQAASEGFMALAPSQAMLTLGMLAYLHGQQASTPSTTY